LNTCRGIAIFVTQVPILLEIGAQFDLLFGFNHTDTAFNILLLLFVLVPLMNLSWLLTEIIMAIKMAKRQNRAMSLLMPGLALFFFLESLFIDIFFVSQARM